MAIHFLKLRFISLPLVSFWLVVSATEGTATADTGPQATLENTSAFVPGALHPVAMAMPMRQFIRDVLSQAPQSWEASPRGTSWFRVFERQPFISATLNFSTRTHQLVEVKLRFHSEVEAHAFAQREIFPRGQPVGGNTDTTIYRVSTRDRTTIDCWVDQQNLYIIARLPEPSW